MFDRVLHTSQNFVQFPPNIYLFKSNNRPIIKRCEISLKLTIKTTEERHLRSGVFNVNSEHISHLFLVLLLLSLERYLFAVFGQYFMHIFNSD